jgi:hypothetical protein
VLNLTEAILKVLSKNSWGIYYKVDPIEKVKAQEGMTLYRVNEINTADFLSSFQECIEESIENKEE